MYKKNKIKSSIILASNKKSDDTCTLENILVLKLNEITGGCVREICCCIKKTQM